MNINNVLKPKLKTAVHRTVLYVRNAHYAHVYKGTEYLYTANRVLYANFVIMYTNEPLDYYIADVIVDGVGDVWIVYKDVDEIGTYYITKIPRDVMVGLELSK